MIEHLPGILIVAAGLIGTAAFTVYRKIQWSKRWYDGVSVIRGHHVRCMDGRHGFSQVVRALLVVDSIQGASFRHGVRLRRAEVPKFWVEIVKPFALERPSDPAKPRMKGRMRTERELPITVKRIVLQVESANAGEILLHEAAHAIALETFGDSDPYHLSPWRDAVEAELVRRFRGEA